jgi:hypothetical protein
LVVHNVCDPELLARCGAGSFDDVTKTRGQPPSFFKRSQFFPFAPLRLCVRLKDPWQQPGPPSSPRIGPRI